LSPPGHPQVKLILIMDGPGRAVIFSPLGRL